MKRAREDGDAGRSKKRPRKNLTMTAPHRTPKPLPPVVSADVKTVDDCVVGRVLPPEEAIKIKKELEGLISGHVREFPGSHVVSLSENNWRLLYEMEYMVTWKADGSRYLMVILGDRGTFLIDRKMEITKVDIQFGKADKTLLDKTVLDGELTLDKHHDGARPCFYVFDILVCAGNNVCPCDLVQRLNLVKDVVCKRQPADHEEPFSVEAKMFFPCEATKRVSKELIPMLPHESDGYVFTPVNMPYVPGRCDQLLKWKPGDMNSVDFRVARRPDAVPDDEGKVPVDLSIVSGKSQPVVGRMLVTPDEASNLDGKIVECSLDTPPSEGQLGLWTFMRIRVDKDMPNGFKTYESVVKSISNSIDEMRLLSFISARRDYLGKSQSEEENLLAVADFIAEFAAVPNIELEAKLGTIIDKETRCRAKGPTNELILEPAARSAMVFQSSMDPKVFKVANEIYNKKVLDAAAYCKERGGLPSYTYKRIREIDETYDAPPPVGRVRVTKDKETGRVVRVLRKKRLRDIEIFAPAGGLDFRISASSEEDVTDLLQNDEVPGAWRGCLDVTRTKERLSFNFRKQWSIDMTIVTTVRPTHTSSLPSSHGPDVTHEIEIECIDPAWLAQEGRNRSLVVAKALMDRLRSLAYALSPSILSAS